MDWTESAATQNGDYLFYGLRYASYDRKYPPDLYLFKIEMEASLGHDASVPVIVLRTYDRLVEPLDQLGPGCWLRIALPGDESIRRIFEKWPDR